VALLLHNGYEHDSLLLGGQSGRYREEIMKKIVAATLAVLALSACGGTGPEKSKSEAVSDVRAAFDLDYREVPNSDIVDLLSDVCEALDDYSADQMADKLGASQRLTIVIFNNATAAFCPEHRASVEHYLREQGT